MSEFDDLMEEGLQECEGEWKDKIFIDGKELPGVYSDAQSSFDLMDGGPTENIVGYFILRKAVYPRFPKERAQIRVNGETRIVGTVTDDRNSWKIGIESAGK